MKKLIAILSGALIAGPSFAQDMQPVLITAQAEAIIDGCEAYAGDNGNSHAIAVTDLGGHLVAFLRMERNSAGVAAFSIEKAKAVSLWGFATSGMENAVKNVPGFADAPGVVTVAGGVPIYSADGKFRLGAAAASGEPPLEDEACVKAGIEAAGLRHERVRD